MYSVTYMMFLHLDASQKNGPRGIRQVGISAPLAGQTLRALRLHPRDAGKPTMVSWDVLELTRGRRSFPGDTRPGRHFHTNRKSTMFNGKPSYEWCIFHSYV